MVYDIKNYAGNTIGTVEFPDDMPDSVIQEKLAEYAKPASGSELTDLQKLELKSVGYIEFGKKLYTTITEKVWAVNTLAIFNGNPMSVNDTITLLQTSDVLEKSLKSGSLKTAKIIIGQLVAQFPQYSDIGALAINEINSFMGL